MYNKSDPKKPVRKHDRVLEIYTRLLAGEIVSKTELANEYAVNERSIQRDIDSIRDFCSNRTVNGDNLTEIIFDRNVHGYRMVNAQSTSLTNAELFTVAKIILESRSLNHKELKEVITKLIDTCLSPTERKKMSDLLCNEIFHYVEPRHKKNLIGSIWELGEAVYQHRMIKMSYQKTSGEVTTTIVKPVGILCSEYYFYLLAFIGDSDKKHPGYPTVYRIDRIKSYEITKEFFKIPYKDRFEEGEFRKRIPFMFTGKLHKASFIYKGADINAVLDRLPTAQAKKEFDGSYLVTAEIYGQKGLELWLKGQGNLIEMVQTGDN